MASAWDDLDREFQSAGGMSLRYTDPKLFRKFMRRADKLGPLSDERVGEIMREMRSRTLQ